jgi:hypothetical protein
MHVKEILKLDHWIPMNRQEGSRYAEQNVIHAVYD